MPHVPVDQLASALRGSALGAIVFFSAGATWDELMLGYLRALVASQRPIVLVHCPESVQHPPNFGGEWVLIPSCHLHVILPG